MGGCCPGGTYSEVEEPSPATKRRQLAEAAEKRQLDNVNRGVKVRLGVCVRALLIDWVCAIVFICFRACLSASVRFTTYS